MIMKGYPSGSREIHADLESIKVNERKILLDIFMRAREHGWYGGMKCGKSSPKASNLQGRFT